MQGHGNRNSSKMRPLSGQPRLLEDMAVDTLVDSSFGAVVMPLFDALLTVPSRRPFTGLACGGALAGARPTLRTSLWLPGATTVKHCSRGDVCLGGPLSNQQGPLWGAGLRLAVPFVPAGEVRRVSCDDTTKKTAGRHLAGLDR